MSDNGLNNLLEIYDMYVDGKINLDEMISSSQNQVELSISSLKYLFLDIKRKNVISLYVENLELGETNE